MADSEQYRQQMKAVFIDAIRHYLKVGHEKLAESQNVSSSGDLSLALDKLMSAIACHAQAHAVWHLGQSVELISDIPSWFELGKLGSDISQEIKVLKRKSRATEGNRGA